jgi:hypothetical protein
MVIHSSVTIILFNVGVTSSPIRGSHLSVDEAVTHSYSIDLDCINFALEASFNLDISQEKPRSLTNQPGITHRTLN